MTVTGSSTQTEVTEREARQVAEAARETGLAQAQLRQGTVPRPLPARPDPPAPAAADRRGRTRGEEFLAKLRDFCETRSTGRASSARPGSPTRSINGLKELGALGMKIDTKYGGLGLTQVYYNKALVLVGSAQPRDRRAALGASVDRRTAAAEDVRHRGAEARLPAPLRPHRHHRVPAHRARRRLRPGPAARPPPYPGRRRLRPRRRQAVDHQRRGRRPARRHGAGAASPRATGAASPRSSCEADAPGITVENRNAFMGLRGIENGVTRFHQVRVPAANRDRPRGRGPQDRADHPEHRPALAARDVRRRGEVVPEDRPRVVGRPGAVGQAGRRARGGRPEDRLHRGDHLRAGGGAGPVLARWPTRTATTSASRPRWPSCTAPRWPG